MGTKATARLLPLFAAVVLLAACGADEPAGDAAGSTPAAQETAADAGAQEEWEPEFVDGVLQPLDDGFPEDEITLVSVDDPGSKDGIYSRTLDQALEDISPVDVVVSDEPAAAGGTWGALVDVTTRPGGTEGYWMIVGSVQGNVTDLHVEPIEEELGVGIDDMTWVSVTETQPYALISRLDAPWGTSFEDFVQYGRDNPGELRYISTGVGSGSDIGMEWMLTELGIEVNKIPVGGHEEAGAAVGAGEGDFTLARIDIGVQVEETERGKVIYLSTPGVPDMFADNDGIASAADHEEFGLEGPSHAVYTGMFVPAEVPEEHLQWLHALVDAATQTELYQSRAETLPAIELNTMSIEEANQLKQETYESSDPIIRDIGLHKDQ